MYICVLMVFSKFDVCRVPAIAGSAPSQHTDATNFRRQMNPCFRARRSDFKRVKHASSVSTEYRVGEPHVFFSGKRYQTSRGYAVLKFAQRPL